MSQLHSLKVRRVCLAALFLLCILSLMSLAWIGYRLVTEHRYEQRGILPQAPLTSQLPPDRGYGVSASLEQYSSAELRQALQWVKQGGFYWVRQHFPWAEIEPQPGQYDWERWDRLVTEVTQQDLGLIAVLDTSPAWARAPSDRDNRFAPPQYATTYGLFVRAFAQRYAGQISCYQVWDQPNISPYWGSGPVDPRAYVHLLGIAAAEVRTAAPDAIVLSAALAPNTEAGGRNLSDVEFLRGIYEEGGRGLFDVMAAKAYGFWSGPEDRRVDSQVLNFSRLILLREEMARHGDGDRPVWAVEFGWNSLPADWQGQPSPWGTDDIVRQVQRTAQAMQRARQEWGWLGVMCWAQLQPAVPESDPLWGFSLLQSSKGSEPELQPDLVPTAFYDALQQVIGAPIARIHVDNSAYHAKLAILPALALLIALLGVRLWPASSWGPWLGRMAQSYLSAADWLQWLLLGLALLIHCFAPWNAASLLALACAGALTALRPDIGLGYAVFSIPFFLRPRPILGRPFSPPELLLGLCCAGWLLRERRERAAQPPSTREQRWDMRRWLRSLTALDWAAVSFVLVSALSLFVSANRGVSIREFRVIILEPVLLYVLLRQMRLKERQLLWLADALLAAGVVMSLLGLYQYFASGDVIVTEGVRRVRGVYSSPNNLSLLLGRIIPLAITVPIVGRSRRCILYALSLSLLLACLFLTYSRGGWLLSLPAALLAVGLLRGRRATYLALAVIAVCALVLVPLVGTQRFASLLDLEQGTTFRRLRLWEATWTMIRDHPITGVGLDNFLYEYPNYMLADAWQEPDLSHPHNMLLDFWTRLGLAGVGALMWLLGAFFALALRLYRRLPDGDVRAIILGWIASAAAMLAHGLIDNSYFLVDLAFIFFLTLGWTRAAACRPGQVADLEKASPPLSR